MRALFVNSAEPRCGVHQYGENLFRCIKLHSGLEWSSVKSGNYEALATAAGICKPDVIVYNWQSGIGGYMAGAPFEGLGRQVLVYHDNDVDYSRWDAFLFSDPTMASNGKWHSIGRPLPVSPPPQPLSKVITIGVNGFIGAWADRVVEQALKEFEYAEVRIRLPLAVYGDDHGNLAGAMAAKCAEMVKGTGIHVNISHDFLEPDELLKWLAGNTINCYFRDPSWRWRGVSSSLDSALAARRPIAVNRCNAFRHVHCASPSICIEDSSLTEIIAHGVSPLVPFYQKWTAESVAKQVDDVLLSL